jgi:hypothetical protein
MSASYVLPCASRGRPRLSASDWLASLLSAPYKLLGVTPPISTDPPKPADINATKGLMNELLKQNQFESKEDGRLRYVGLFRSHHEREGMRVSRHSEGEVCARLEQVLESGPATQSLAVPPVEACRRKQSRPSESTAFVGELDGDAPDLGRVLALLPVRPARPPLDLRLIVLLAPSPPQRAPARLDPLAR